MLACGALAVLAFSYGIDHIGGHGNLLLGTKWGGRNYPLVW